MASFWNSLKNRLTYVRDKAGRHNYFYNKNNEWGSYANKTNLEIAQNHPILTPAILFRAKLFSQAKFTVRNKITGKEKKNHWMLQLLENPNQYQTQSDFLESLDFSQVAQGKAVGYIKRIPSFNENKDIDSIYLLDSDLIEWGDYSSHFALQRDKRVDNQEIIYDKNGENITIKVKDLLFFYDLPNCLSDNFYEVKSRLDGLKQTLINTQDSLIAKNIILKTNGKELISGGINEFLPLEGEDKANAENLLQNNYGLGWFRKRGIVTRANINYQSLHIALRDLGLDESVKVDGNIIYTALHIPKDIISLEAKKTTYNNFKESMVSYIQNEMQGSVDAFTAVMNTLIEDNYELVGDYEHLPIMQFILIERYDGVIKKAMALRSLLQSGVPKEVALELSGFDKTMTLEEIQQETQPNTQNNGESEEDKKWRKAIEERLNGIEEEQE